MLHCASLCFALLHCNSLLKGSIVEGDRWDRYLKVLLISIWVLSQFPLLVSLTLPLDIQVEARASVLTANVQEPVRLPNLVRMAIGNTGEQTSLAMTLFRKLAELVQNLFEVFDLDGECWHDKHTLTTFSSGGGSVDIEELETIMRSLGRKPSLPELLELTGVDSNGEALELDFYSFARIMVAEISVSLRDFLICRYLRMTDRPSSSCFHSWKSSKKPFCFAVVHLD